MTIEPKLFARKIVRALETVFIFLAAPAASVNNVHLNQFLI